jgi:hypothetical protein
VSSYSAQAAVTLPAERQDCLHNDKQPYWWGAPLRWYSPGQLARIADHLLAAGMETNAAATSKAHEAVASLSAHTMAATYAATEKVVDTPTATDRAAIGSARPARADPRVRRAIQTADWTRVRRRSHFAGDDARGRARRAANRTARGDHRQT